MKNKIKNRKKKFKNKTEKIINVLNYFYLLFQIYLIRLNF